MVVIKKKKQAGYFLCKWRYSEKKMQVSFVHTLLCSKETLWRLRSKVLRLWDYFIPYTSNESDMNKKYIYLMERNRFWSAT